MTTPINVRLDQREMFLGVVCGAMRNIYAMRDRLSDAHGFDEEYGWNAHIEGSCGEIAAAKVMGRYWSPTVNTFHAADLGERIQVRTRSRHDYELHVRPNDNPDHLYVLVTGKAPVFVVRGYYKGCDAQRAEWFKDHGGRPHAWFVPQDQLLDIRGLIRSEGVELFA